MYFTKNNSIGFIIFFSADLDFDLVVFKLIKTNFRDMLLWFVVISQGTKVSEHYWHQEKAIRHSEEDNAKPALEEHLKDVTWAWRQRQDWAERAKTTVDHTWTYHWNGFGCFVDSFF